MQKKLLSAAVWLSLILTLLPFPVRAAEPYGIRIGDIEVTDENAADVLGDADGDAATVVCSLTDGTSVLRLTGASLPAVFSDHDLCLILDGDSTVTAGSSAEGNSTGIRVNGSLTVSESAAGGSLTVTAGTGVSCIGLSAEQLTVNGGTLTVRAGSGSFESHGIFAGGMTVNGGTVRAVSGSSTYSCGVNIEGGGLSMTGGSLTAESGSADEFTSTALFAETHITVSGGTIEARGGYSSGYADSCGIATTKLLVTGGSVTGTAVNTIAARASVGISAAEADLSGGEVTGISTATGSGSAYGIHVFLTGDEVEHNGRMTVSGTARVTAKCASTSKNTYYAICAGGLSAVDFTGIGGLFCPTHLVTGAKEPYTDGIYELHQTSSDTPVVIAPLPPVKGDVNRDGRLDDLDVLLFARYFAGHPVGSEIDLTLPYADIDGDRTVTRRDAMLLARRFSGWTE